MQIPEGLFGKCNNDTSSRIANKGFEPTKGLNQPLRIISENRSAVYIIRVYWE